MADSRNGSRVSGKEHPIAVISMGSNDLHLLVATSDGESRFEVQADHALLIELVASIKGGVLPPEALNRALTAVGSLVQEARAAGATNVIALGTEALREAANGSAFLALLSTTFDIIAMEITGEQEAALDYSWALFPAAPPAVSAEHEPHWLVIDSGGGSTQVIVGAGEKPVPSWSTSLPIGAGSLTAQFCAHDPPKRKELQAMAAKVVEEVDPLPRRLPPDIAVSAILMGGSADHMLRLTAHPEQAILTTTDLEAVLNLLHDKPASKVARTAGIPVERARLLPAGATILWQLMTHYGITTAAVKAHGIRGGLVVSYARAGVDWQRQLAKTKPPRRLEARAIPSKARTTSQARPAQRAPQASLGSEG